MKTLHIRTELLETMLYLWASLSERQKIQDRFLIEFAQHPDMQAQYDDDFGAESVRTVLSAIANRERINHPTQKESRFWNHNLWMMEDPLIPQSMLGPIKTLSAVTLKEAAKETRAEEAAVVFYPGTTETAFTKGNTLYVNFFAVKADPFDETKEVTVEGTPLTAWLVEQLKAL